MSIYGVRVFRCRPAGGLSSSPAARPSEGLVSMSIYGVRALSRPAGGLSYSPAACPSTQRCAASQHAGACAYWARGQTSPWMLRMRAAVPGSSPGSPALMRYCVHMNKFLSLSLSLSHTHTHTHTQALLTMRNGSRHDVCFLIGATMSHRTRAPAANSKNFILLACWW